ncbi:glutathione S-transferase family protein [Aliikangiella marina]|uniref:Glutathione S-transferase family protein n=1 Tax=Aliikangiella marina TaxID=1712262 RepID=A0A545T506_9GAMM|nr:glutathione S-transferase family protein [Aliikangiella marina]TQV72248.1 glutathione S-transferase family protein [Aliikangiella marina]
MLTLFGDIVSGNCYKAYLLLNLLEIDFKWVNVNVLEGEAATDEFRQMNPNAKIPLLQLDSGEYLSESNAILNYLAEGTEFLPKDRFLRAKVLEWQFFEQYSHEPYIAVARFINKYQGLPDERKAEYESKQPGGHKALSIMDARLESHDYLVGDQYTIADISLYAYTHVAEEGGFDLSHYPAIAAWFKRIESHPNHVGMSLKPEHQG